MVDRARDIVDSVPESAGPWFDSHCHLTDPRFEADFDEVLTRARLAGVRAITVVGESIEAARAAVALSERHPGAPPAEQQPTLYAAVGLHPHRAKDWSPEGEARLIEMCRGSRRIVAIGETGLDFYYDFSPREEQKKAFLGQARLASEMSLPLIIHCRDAYDLVVEMMRAEGMDAIGGVVHCFSGDRKQARAILDLGFRIGVAGPLTFKKNEEFRELVRYLPLEAIVLETDAPYLAPEPYRGRRNEPALVAATGRRLAEVLGLTEHDLAESTFQNAVALYHITIAK